MTQKSILLVLGHPMDAPKILNNRIFKTFGYLEEAVESVFFRRNSFPSFDAVVLCGGKTSPAATQTEAEIMGQMLRGLAMGTEGFLPELLLEGSSLNTLERMNNGVQLLMDKYPDDRFTLYVVTHDWHANQVRNYWEKSDCLAKARERCDLDLSSFLVRSWKSQGLTRWIQLLAAWESAWDPNRNFLNWVRPHSV